MKQFLDHASMIVTRGVVLAILVLVPFHGFLTVWGSSLVGHYTALRLWEEYLLVPGVLTALYIVFRDSELRRRVTASWLWRLIAAYLAVLLIWSVVVLVWHEVSLKAVAYGLLVDARYLVFFFIAWVTTVKTDWLRTAWRNVVLIPAAVVMGVGLLQRYVLPHDFLRHFGYQDATIAPFETIDHKVEYLRVQSTLRGANLLGAYCILVATVVLTVFRQAYKWLALLVVLLVLFLSGSRGAWIGAAVAIGIVVLLQLPGRRLKRYALVAGACLLLAGTAGVIALRDVDFVQNTIFHTDERSTSSESSNAAHIRLAKEALVEVVQEPFGEGPGSAGPASVYNHGSSRIAENYFLQIGQEVGWLGLGLLIGIFVLVGRQLWTRRKDELALAMFASLLGISCVAMLMHIWTDETIAFMFWGLAAIALAPSVKSRENSGKQMRKQVREKS
jgi:O-antigen ligase